MRRYGRSVDQNQEIAERWILASLPTILRLAQQGVAWAQADLGVAYELGIALKQDFTQAAYWYQRSASQNSASAQTNLAVLYANGTGVHYNRPKAIELLKKAASQGDSVAKNNLRIMGVDF